MEKQEWLKFDIPKSYKLLYAPKEITGLDQIDAFIDSLNVEMFRDSQECFLKMHTNAREFFLKEAKKVADWNGRITRYRGYLLIFDSDMPPGLIYIDLIFNEICFLRQKRFKTLKDRHMLNYLIFNRFKF